MLGTANVTLLGETCGTLSLGSSAGSGTVLMTSGSLNTTGYENVGDSGIGSFTLTGGTNSASTDLNVGQRRRQQRIVHPRRQFGLLSAENENIGNWGAAASRSPAAPIWCPLP